MESIYPLTRRDKRPKGKYPRERVASYLSQRVHQLDESAREWCEYIATLCPYSEWDGDQAFFPEDWCDVEDFAREWQEVPEEVVKASKVQDFVMDEHPYSGTATTRPEGDLIVMIGTRGYYKSFKYHPFDLAFAERYMDDLEKYSHVIHPMRLKDYAGILDHGWMFKKRRKQVALELLSAIKRNTDLPLYIPGDGIGIFSLVARQLEMSYVSSEPAECGFLAVAMGLITQTDVYRPQTTGMVLVASQLVPFVPAVVHHKGPRVIFDQQRWYDKHPVDLRIIPSTGHRVSYTGKLLKGYQPMVLRKEGFSGGQLQYLIQKSEDEDGHVVCNDKSLLSKCLLSGFPVSTEAYAEKGPEGWLRTAPTSMHYVRIGRARGDIDPIRRADHNHISTSQALGPGMPVFYGRSGDRVYSPYHEFTVPFSEIMMWVEPGNFFRMKGAYRERIRYRAMMWPMAGGERTVIRVRCLPEPVVAVQFGNSMYSAEVRENEREYVGGWWYIPVEIGVRVARVQEVKRLRGKARHVIEAKIRDNVWPETRAEYENGVRVGVFDKVLL